MDEKKKTSTRDAVIGFAALFGVAYLAARVGGRHGARIAIKAAANTPITVRFPGYHLVQDVVEQAL